MNNQIRVTKEKHGPYSDKGVVSSKANHCDVCYKMLGEYHYVVENYGNVNKCFGWVCSEECVTMFTFQHI